MFAKSILAVQQNSWRSFTAGRKFHTVCSYTNISPNAWIKLLRQLIQFWEMLCFLVCYFAKKTYYKSNSTTRFKNHHTHIQFSTLHFWKSPFQTSTKCTSDIDSDCYTRKKNIYPFSLTRYFLKHLNVWAVCGVAFHSIALEFKYIHKTSQFMVSIMETTMFNQLQTFEVYSTC